VAYEDEQINHHMRWVERPATKVTGYANEARLRGLAQVVGMMVILLMFISRRAMFASTL
jgi:hypothetical protein